MSLMLIVAILAISAVPVYAQEQRPNVEKLKKDAQNVFKIISADKLKNSFKVNEVIVSHRRHDGKMSPDQRRLVFERGSIMPSPGWVRSRNDMGV